MAAGFFLPIFQFFGTRLRPSTSPVQVSGPQREVAATGYLHCAALGRAKSLGRISDHEHRQAREVLVSLSPSSSGASSATFKSASLHRAVARLFPGPALRATPVVPVPELAPTAPRETTAEIAFDCRDDTEYAAVEPAFHRVAHVFHQAWHGIRSACGALPGRKIALPHTPQLPAQERRRLAEMLDLWRIRSVVFHGWSPAAEQALGVVLASDIPAYVVWHGNLAPLVWSPEGEYFNTVLEHCRAGHFKRAHMLKHGMARMFPNGYGPVLVNRAPMLKRTRPLPAFGGTHRSAIVPALPDIKKNFYTNLLGACASPHLDQVFFYGKLVAQPPGIEKATRIRYGGHEEHLRVVAEMDVCLNVTVIDCHPMVDLEAIATGTPTLSGPLNLGALESHPYTELSVVRNPFDIDEISGRVDRLASVGASELAAVITDYRSSLGKVSTERYADFLGL
jgi:hypothetical protein